MFSGNGYPMGSANDPNAPWNERETTFEKKVGVYVTLYLNHVTVTMDKSGELVSNLMEDVEDQLEDAVRKGDCSIEDAEID